MTNTERLIEILKKSGTYHRGTVSSHKVTGAKYRYDSWYIKKPFPWVVQIFKRASKENNGEYRSFTNGKKNKGYMGFHCDLSPYKGGIDGMLSMKELILM